MDGRLALAECWARFLHAILSTNDKERAVKNAKCQLVFFLTCIALLWFESTEPPKSPRQQAAWQSGVNGG